MKKFTLILSIILVVGLAGCTTDYPSEIQVYGFDTAVVQYELSGQNSGSTTLYMRGDQTAEFETLTTGEKEQNTIILSLGSEKFIVDVDRATAVKTNDSGYEKVKGMSKEDQERYLVKKALGLKDSAADPEIFSTKVVAGQNCNIYIIPNIGSACVWNGILLEKEISILDATNMQVAVSVQTNVEIPSERFELPANTIVK